LIHRKAVFIGEPLTLQSAERDERVVVTVIVEEILEERRRADIVQYGGESLSAGAVDRRCLGGRARKSNCGAGRVEGVLAKSRHGKSWCNTETRARKWRRNKILAKKMPYPRK
jgi:hypothetical protein